MYPNSDLGEARSSSSIRTAHAGDANGVSKVAVICDRNATPFGSGATDQYLQPEIHNLYERVVGSYLKNAHLEKGDER
jgi:hypothetical protein